MLSKDSTRTTPLCLQQYVMVGLKSSAPDTVQERQYFSSTEGLPPVITTPIGGAINEGERVWSIFYSLKLTLSNVP